MAEQFDVIAILGRGIEQVRYGSGVTRWRPTTFVEKCAPATGAHTGFRTICADQNDPDCLIGGGNANVIAGLELFRRYGAKAVLFAYGAKSPYLKAFGAPSEGEVMLWEFMRRVRAAGVSLGNTKFFGGLHSDDPRYRPSNTFKEIENIMNFAVDSAFVRIAIVTVEVQLRRAQVFTEEILQSEAGSGVDGFWLVETVWFSSEEILCQRSPRYRRVIEVVQGSSSRARTFMRELDGIKAFREGRYRSRIH
ncbi:MAG: hypothetical protein HYS57_02175 [Parcubacteria group bacterium]|nr:hypothetical protein [Parcubacteria group bacterium]